MIIVVASIKGGTGKTTVSSNLSVMRAENAADVLLVDADSQTSAFDFAAVRSEEGHDPEITATTILGKAAGNQIRKLAPKFDDIVVDVGGRDSSTLRSILLIADKVVIPFLPSQFDAWSLEAMDGLIGDALQLNPELEVVAVLNKVDTNPRIGLSDDASNFTNNLKNIPCPKVRIGYRVSYRRSIADGISVTELKSRKDPKSIKEMNVLYDEVFTDAT